MPGRLVPLFALFERAVGMLCRTVNITPTTNLVVEAGRRPLATILDKWQSRTEGALLCDGEIPQPLER